MLSEGSRFRPRMRTHTNSARMPAIYLLTFLPERRTEDFAGSREDYYRLPDGAEIMLYSAPAWCGRCAKVVHGEEIESVDAIDKRIANLERLAAEIRCEMTHPPLPTPNVPGDRYQQEQIAELKLRCEWRTRRSSPPKCLTCGSTVIVPLDDGKTMRITGGSVRCDFTGMGDTASHMRYYSPDGELIESL